MLRLGLAFSILAVAAAVNVGDELYAGDSNGRFYVLADKVIQIIDPANMTVVVNITRDQYDMPLVNTANGKNVSKVWNDAVYVQNSTANTRLVFINEADVYTEPTGASYSFVTVVDAVSQKIVGRPKVGARPVHIYAVNGTAKAWSHSDAEGVFHVITSANTGGNWTFGVKQVKSYLQTGGHGKLIINDALYPIAYAEKVQVEVKLYNAGTNVAEPVFSKFDISNDTLLKQFSYNTSLFNASTCPGTHSAYYSRQNKHVYFECSDGGGVLEWNAVNDTFVHQHSNKGTIFGTPRDDRIFVTNSANSSSTILIPGVNGVKSTEDVTLVIPSMPSDPVFYTNSTSITPSRFGNYSAWFPTARNTNKNNIAAAGADLLLASYAARPSDCRYSNQAIVSTASGAASVGTGLQLARGANGVLSPQCGACAAGISGSDPSQFDTSLAGFRVARNLSASLVETHLVMAGAVAPLRSLASTANECSFASVSRAAKKGGGYVVTIADLPQPSLYVVDPSRTTAPGPVRGFVATAAAPKKVVWVPSATATLTG